MTEGSQAQGSGKATIVVIGDSMYPTLRHLDLVYITPVTGQGVRVGDVIVYSHQCNCKKVVHRVVSVKPDGIQTKGDSLIHVDNWVTNPDAVVGRVELAQRGNRQRHIHGGKAGQFVGLTGYAYAELRGFVRRPIWQVYRLLSWSGIFRVLVPGRMKPRILTFSKPGGVEMQLLMGRWTVGTRPPGRKSWKIKPPFRLFIDESALIVPGEEQCQPGVCKYEN